MKKITLWSFMLLTNSLVITAQWKTDYGPCGGGFEKFIEIDGVLFVNSNYGIYKSEDFGDTWTNIYEPPQSSPGLSFPITSFDFFDGELYVGVSNNGIFKSQDNGTTWLSLSNAMSDKSIYAIHKETDKVFIGDIYGGIYYSPDNGQTWYERSLGIESIQVSDIDMLGTEVFIAGGESIYKTNDDGITWSEISIPDLGQGTYSLTVNNNHIYVGALGGVFVSSDGINFTRCPINVSASIDNVGVSGDSVYAATTEGKYFISTDNGVSWSAHQNTEVISFARRLIFKEDEILMSTTFDGLYKSIDGGLNWHLSCEGINETLISTISSNNSHLLVGTEGNGLYIKPFDHQTWKSIDIGQNSNHVTSSLSIADTFYVNTSDGIYKNLNNSSNWTQVLDIQYGIQVMDFNNGKFFALSVTNELLLSLDTAKSWEYLPTDELNVNTYYHSLSTKGDSIFLGSQDGAVYFSPDLGSTWSEIGKISILPIYRMALIGEILFATTNEGIMYSADLETWQVLHNDHQNFYDFEFVNGKFYATTSNGINLTTLDRDSWVSDQGSLNQRLHKLLIANDTLYTGPLFSSLRAIPLRELNLAPHLSGSKNLLSTLEDNNFELKIDHLVYSDPDNDLEDLSIIISEGAGYTVNGTSILPDQNFNGTLQLAVQLFDGLELSSEVMIDLTIEPVNDPPIINSQITELSTRQERPITLDLSNISVSDVDNQFPDDFTLSINEGENYTIDGLTVIPAGGFIGDLPVSITVNDGSEDSESFNLNVIVLEPLSSKNSQRVLMNVYPNPSNNVIMIEYENHLRNNVSLVITDITGRGVFRKNYHSDLKIYDSLNLATFQKGIYMLKISTGSTSESVRIIIN